MGLFRPPPPKPKSDDERVLPLINVVFLLLIFFMLAGRLVASDAFRIEPPQSASDGPVRAQGLVVLVAADGRLALDNVPVEATALRSAVADRIAEQPALRVRLKADGAADASRVVGVMEALRAAGVAELQLLTVSGE